MNWPTVNLTHRDAVFWEVAPLDLLATSLFRSRLLAVIQSEK